MVAPEWPPTTVTFSFAGSVPLISEMKRLARTTDRKSTRLNSSHSQISYAVFCLKKKKVNHRQARHVQVWPLTSCRTTQSRQDLRPVFAVETRQRLHKRIPPVRFAYAGRILIPRR